ncbi:MAG: hypothetical protein ACOX68_08275 [Candidatus Limivicinus sp.]|jgi:TolA-binding protein
MGERYSIIYRPEHMFYADGAPVVAAASALLEDSLTRSVLVQVKFENISDKTVKSLKLEITPLDTAGHAAWDKVEYQYMDLAAKRDDCFGQKAAVIMPDNRVRSFTLAVSEVIFSDNSSWDGSGSEWVKIGCPRLLSEAYGDDELSEQFAIRYGADCKYLPEEQRDLWYCTCGAINSAAEPKCHSCRRVFAALKDVNLSSLRSECAQRVESEKIEEEEVQEEQHIKLGKYKKLIFILVPVIAVLILIAATVPGFIARKNDYNYAVQLLESQEFDRAQEAFEAMGSYSDCREQAEKNVPYRKAMYIMSCAEKSDIKGLELLNMRRSQIPEGDSVSVALYRAAESTFGELGNYKDSAVQKEKAQAAVSSYYDAKLNEAYDAAAALLDEKKYCEARDAFLALDSYSDSADMARECMYMRAVALYEVTAKYSMRGICADISSETGVKSVIYIPETVFSKLGKSVSSDLRDVLHEDGVEINIKEVPESGFAPICDCVSQLFSGLGDYKDSAEYIEKAEEAGDFSRPFYEYCSSGQLPAAYLWLSEYDGEIKDRDWWVTVLENYIPYCGAWEFYSGDPTLIPFTVGIDARCTGFTSGVVIDGDEIKLRINLNGDTDYPIDIPVSENPAKFSVCPDGACTYIAALGSNGRLNYSKYLNSAAKPLPQSSCEYSKLG